MVIKEINTNILEQVFTLSKPIKEKKSESRIKLIVGLGNPEKKYFNTYHNVGFCFIDKLSSTLDIKVKKKECKSLTGEGFIEREETSINLKTGKLEPKFVKEKIILAKPQTYMNLSGEAVSQLIKKYKLSFDEILIISDDIDLKPGTYRFRENGSAGTHNGLRNIIQILKTTDFKRIRFGIGRNENLDLADYVLSKVSKENKDLIDEAMERALDHIISILK